MSPTHQPDPGPSILLAGGAASRSRLSVPCHMLKRPASALSARHTRVAPSCAPAVTARHQQRCSLSPRFSATTITLDTESIL